MLIELFYQGLGLIQEFTSNRPTNVLVGFQYFDSTLSKPIYYKGNNEWVDATGATV